MLALCLLLLSLALPSAAEVHLGDPCLAAARQDGTDIAVPYIMQRQDDGSEVPVFLRHTTTSTAGNGTRRWRRGATSYRHLLWPNATVVYSIGTEYTVLEREFILEAMREWENQTCIRFKERENETSYIHFFKGTGCCSFVGFLNYGCQRVSIAQNCLNHATILHEIGHTIGFWHEQSRPDRDEHVSVLLYNIVPRYRTNFLKKDRSQVNSMGVPYDYNSIMHYPEGAFSRQPGRATLLSKEWGIPLGNAHELSPLDVLQANKLYKCGSELRPKLVPARRPVLSPTTPVDLPTPSKFKDCFTTLFTAGASQLSSPNYPFPYPIRQDCAWRITVPKGHYISISFNPLRLPSNDPCRDYVEVYDGLTLSSRLLRRLCGQWVRYAFRTTTNKALVVFHSDNHPQPYAGFKANYSATDTNECAADNGNCDHLCTNTPGSFLCSCHSGYYLSSNGRRCHDVNECGEDNGACSHLCVNTAGSYRCDCLSGYKLGFDLRTCTSPSTSSPYNPCLINNGNCSQLCHLAGRYPHITAKCHCQSGYTLNTDGHTCDEVDECARDSSVCAPGRCVNTLGSYRCDCLEGFTTLVNTPGCQDVDECSQGNNGGCQHECVNTPGAFYCACYDGYRLQGDNSTCRDVNECHETRDPCHHFCINNLGAYTCRCEYGYSLQEDGFTCEDINECEVFQSVCDQVCVNANGSFHCACAMGFAMTGNNGTTCEDVNECSRDAGGCDDTCVNTEGSYHCHCSAGLLLAADGHSCLGGPPECSGGSHGCPPLCSETGNCTCARGHRLSSSGRICIDVNECIDDNAASPCQHHCTNTLGSYQCSCGIGYTLTVDGHTCTPRSCDVLNGECDHMCFKDIFNQTKCKCRPGYVLGGNGVSCSKYDTASLVHACQLPCSHLCTVRGPTHTCRCYPGYQLAEDGVTCGDINECSLQNGGCSHGCKNSLGAYQCTCPRGLELSNDLQMCADINECLATPPPCKWRCVNTKGSFRCECPDNFVLDAGSERCLPLCGGYFTQTSGALSTPRYPLQYSSNLECWWLISVPDEYAVDLQLHVDTDWTPACAGDAVEVFNGVDGGSPMMARVCGHRIRHSLTSSTSNVAVRFKSDLYRKAVRSGLYFTYSLGTPIGDFRCGGVKFMAKGPLWIGNPHFPSLITSKQSCSWLILNNSKHPTKNVTVHFLYFDVFSVTARGCADDHITISGAREGVIYNICSPSDLGMLIISERVFSIWFQAAALGKFRGFHMKLAFN